MCPKAWVDLYTKMYRIKFKVIFKIGFWIGNNFPSPELNKKIFIFFEIKNEIF